VFEIYEIDMNIKKCPTIESFEKLVKRFCKYKYPDQMVVFLSLGKVQVDVAFKQEAKMAVEETTRRIVNALSRLSETESPGKKLWIAHFLKLCKHTKYIRVSFTLIYMRTSRFLCKKPPPHPAALFLPLFVVTPLLRLRTNSGKVLNTTMTLPTRPLDPRVTQTPKP